MVRRREQLPVDVAVRDVADAGDAGGEGFDRVDPGRSSGWRDAEADQQGVREHPECHAERPVDDLRAEADRDEGQEVEIVERIEGNPRQPLIADNL